MRIDFFLLYPVRSRISQMRLHCSNIACFMRHDDNDDDDEGDVNEGKEEDNSNTTVDRNDDDDACYHTDNGIL